MSAELPGCRMVVADAVAVLVGLPIVWAGALTILWDQNVVPLGAMPLGVGQFVGLFAFGMAGKLLITGLPKEGEYVPGEGVRKACTTSSILLALVGMSTLASWAAP